MNRIQKVVDEWVSQPQHKVKYFPPFELCAQLSEEIGEVAREVAHLYGYKKKKEGEKTDGLEGEIGDVLFVLACLANSQGIDLDEAFNKSVEKKNQRDKHRFE
ncbi:MAG: nucleotide pyrophosphohydrolase [Candidatus Falkowbacteria bacterium]|nr:nucleotide pyrophosphohydrolase [Candidatus Falkowbacteria bacterium]